VGILEIEMSITESTPAMDKNQLNRLYARYNLRKWVHPDPLEFLYDYPDLKDREIAGMVASSLAYGRVNQILKSVSTVLKEMKPSPYAFLKSATSVSLKHSFKDFRHRFTGGDDLAAMLLGIKRMIERHGSIYGCFLAGLNNNDETILPALSSLVKELMVPSNGCSNSLIPLPEKGSACKRLNLFLRWMVRKDRVDPGGWKKVSPAKLIVPLDTHMHRISTMLKMTARKSADMRTALEITNRFREILPEDPVKYDFSLTRLGIRDDVDIDQLKDLI